MLSDSVQLYADDDVLSHFYSVLASRDNTLAKSIHIPMSDVFYVREAIRLNTGVTYTLDHVERAMYLEGYLSRNDVLDPDRKRDWE